MMRWQSEGFCFQSTGLNADAQGALNPTTLKDQWGLPHAPEPVRDPRAGFPGCERYSAPDYVDDFNDGYAVVPIELDYKTVAGQAYFNKSTGLKISHYPVVHTRAGSIGFKVEWNDLSMLYSSDTKPEWNSVRLGDGVDVYIHEMAVPPEIWAMKIQGLSQPGEGPEWQAMLDWTKRVQDSSHTTPGAFGYMLSQMNQLPRLVVPTHFITADDTVNCALESIRAHVPGIGRLGEKIAWSYDLMVLKGVQGPGRPVPGGRGRLLGPDALEQHPRSGPGAAKVLPPAERRQGRQSDGPARSGRRDRPGDQ